jgi:hypothetical protein
MLMNQRNLSDWIRWPAKGLAVLALAAGLFFSAERALGDGGGMNCGGGDQIGTLPLSTFPPEQSNTHPSFVVQGTLEDLITSVVAAEGTGSAALWGDEATNQWTLAFYGQVRVWFARNYVESGLLQTSLGVSEPFVGGLAKIRLNGKAKGRIALPSGQLPMPLTALVQSGVLDGGKLMMHSVSANKQLHQVLELSAQATTVCLELRD